MKHILLLALLATSALAEDPAGSNPVTRGLRFGADAISRNAIDALISAGASAKAPVYAPPVIREMDTDRPDTTESAFTVPRGMWQFELEPVSVTRDGGSQIEDWGAANIKYGLGDTVDLQWVTPAWHTEDEFDGWTDTEIRLKWNLSGQTNDAAVAVALMPYLKIPVASDDVGNGDVEGGLIIPMALTKSDIFDLAWMIQADVLRNDDDDGWTGEFTLTGTAGFELGGPLSAFIETAALLPLDNDTELYLNGGLIYALNDNWRLDTGVNIGLNEPAGDFRIFAGTSFRF